MQICLIALSRKTMNQKSFQQQTIFIVYLYALITVFIVTAVFASTSFVQTFPTQVRLSINYFTEHQHIKTIRYSEIKIIEGIKES